MTTILEQVVQHERCCCCGMCAAVCPRQRLTIRETDFGEFFPHALEDKNCGGSCNVCLSVCPVANNASQTVRLTHQTYVGGVSQDAERLKAPSGGFATALLCRLLEEQKIDAAVVAAPIAERPWFERHRERLSMPREYDEVSNKNR